MKYSSKLKLWAVHVLSVGALLCMSLGVASPASAAASPALKPAPTAPPQAQNVITAPIPSKATKAKAGLSASAAVTPAIAWTVSLSASPSTLWPTQYSTLTATANQNVGPTPYYISIFDQTSHTYVAICGTGTTCSNSVTQANATTHTYQAYVSLFPSANPPAGIQATSGVVTVIWKSVGISLKASPTTLAIGGTTTLTSTTTADVGPSPFYTEIFDATTHTRVGSACGFGITCTVTTSQPIATTHRYIAYVSNYSTAFPPTGVQAFSNSSFVTWANTGYQISLTATRTSYGHDTVTAKTNKDVLPTPYWIQIFSETTGARVATCGGGTTCSANVALNFGKNDFVAFVSSLDTTLPPANIQASSNVVTDYFFPIFIPR